MCRLRSWIVMNWCQYYCELFIYSHRWYFKRLYYLCPFPYCNPRYYYHCCYDCFDYYCNCLDNLFFLLYLSQLETNLSVNQFQIDPRNFCFLSNRCYANQILCTEIISFLLNPKIFKCFSFPKISDQCDICNKRAKSYQERFF